MGGGDGTGLFEFILVVLVELLHFRIGDLDLALQVLFHPEIDGGHIDDLGIGGELLFQVVHGFSLLGKFLFQHFHLGGRNGFELLFELFRGEGGGRLDPRFFGGGKKELLIDQSIDGHAELLFQKVSGHLGKEFGGNIA